MAMRARIYRVFSSEIEKLKTTVDGHVGVLIATHYASLVPFNISDEFSESREAIW
jgi:hypothetical protein